MQEGRHRPSILDVLAANHWCNVIADENFCINRVPDLGRDCEERRTLLLLLGDLHIEELDSLYERSVQFYLDLDLKTYEVESGLGDLYQSNFLIVLQSVLDGED